MSELVTLDSVAKFLSGGTPSKNEPSYWSGKIPWVSGKDMKSFLLEDSEDHLSEEGVKNGSKLAPARSTLLLVRGMSLHEEIRVCIAVCEVAFNQDVKALVAKPGIDPVFLAYSLEGRHHELLELVDAASHGTGRILSEALEGLLIWVPEVSVQHGIAQLLWSIDCRIRLNERMNASLEAAAAALFRSWFVDFEPIAAKIEGRKPFSMSNQVASLFPSEFEDGAPAGWTNEPLSAIATQSKAQTSPKEARTIYFDHYSIPAYDEGKVPVRELGSSIQSNKFLVPENSILVSKLNPENPRVWWPLVDVNANCCVCSTEFLVLQTKAGVPLSYLYCLMTEQGFRDELCGLVNGTSNSHQRVTPDDFMRIRFVRPSPEILLQFDRLVAPMFARIHLNSRQSLVLNKLRNALLSPLISGELRLKEAGQQVKAALS